MPRTRTPLAHQAQRAGEGPPRLTPSRIWGLAAVAATFALGFLALAGITGSPIVFIVAMSLLCGRFVASAVAELKQLWPGAPPRRRGGYVVALVGSTLLLIAVGVVTRAAAPLPTMPGTRDVAVIGYLAPTSETQSDYDDLASAITDVVRPGGASQVKNYAPQTDPPLEALRDAGTVAQLDHWVEDFQQQTRAELVLSGYAEPSGAGQLAVRTLVYVPERMANDAAELVGWYEIDHSILDRSLTSPKSRAIFLQHVAEQFRGLSQFLTGLDAWQSGFPDEAIEALGRTIENGEGSTLTDLARLFRGHARETKAMGVSPDVRDSLLASAATDYRSIDSESPIRPRADVSAATNAYLTTLQGDCSRGEAASLAASSQALAKIADNQDHSELLRRKAQVNRAQVEMCRSLAGARGASGELDALLAELTRLRVPSPDESLHLLAQVKALALSIASVRSAKSGDLAEAIETIASALELDPRFENQALWRGLRSAWLLRQCRIAEGRADQQEALRQLDAAREQGRVSPERPAAYQRAFARDLAHARKRCFDSDDSPEE